MKKLLIILIVLLSTLTSVAQSLVREKLYLQTDRTFYKPYEDLCFSAFLRESTTLLPSLISQIITVELIAPNGTIQKSETIYVENAVAKGDFYLDGNGGLYKLRAYTNFMKNFGLDYVFEKEIQLQTSIYPKLLMKLEFLKKAYGKNDSVIAKLDLSTTENHVLAWKDVDFTVQVNSKEFLKATAQTDSKGTAYLRFRLPDTLKTNDGLLNVLIDYQGDKESISRSIPIVLNDIDLQFLPEGGHLVSNLDNRIAFIAIDEFGKPADIEGVIVDSSYKTVTKFKSYHDGMGAFCLNTPTKQSYKARITKPEGITKLYDLPKVVEQGTTLQIIDNKVNSISLKVHTNTTKKLFGHISIGEKIIQTFNVDTTAIHLNLNCNASIAKITIVDSKNEPQCERLVFVNKHQQMKVKITTNKTKYLPREKVEMTIQTTDNQNNPLSAQLSLAVVDDKNLSFADDKQDNILSHLLMSSDLKGKIYDPQFYFKPNESKADSALDLVMMTHGWRKFSIQKREIVYKANREFRGCVIDDKGIRVRNALLIVKETLDTIQCNSRGEFAFYPDNIYKTYTLNAYDSRGNKHSIATHDVNFQFYGNRSVEPLIVRGRVRDAKGEGIAYATVAEVRGGRVITGVSTDEYGEFTIKVSSPNVMLRVKMVGFDDKEENLCSRTRINFILKTKGRTTSCCVIGGRSGYDGGGYTSGYSGGGFTPSMSKRKVDARTEKIEAEFQAYQARKNQITTTQTQEVYTPKYIEPIVERTDFRSTLYWNPIIVTDTKGIATVSFCNSDESTTFRAIAEGISSNGKVGREEYTYHVQQPLSMSVKVPDYLSFGDKVNIPLTLTNHTQQVQKGKLSITAPKGLKAIHPILDTVSIEPNSTKTIFLNYFVENRAGKDEFRIQFSGSELGDAFSQSVEILPKGFPISVSFAGKELEKNGQLEIGEVIEGSLKSEFNVYTDILQETMKGIESILQEPHGCFEQVSSSTYPNILVLNYLQKTGTTNYQLKSKALKLIDKGYKALAAYETSEKGFEWFGHLQPHETLTAYGLLEFYDMKKVYNGVDNAMLERTQKWLLSRKDGNGGFNQNCGKYGFTDKNREVNNAYIVYALSEIQCQDIDKELFRSYQIAQKDSDVYKKALIANAFLNRNDTIHGEGLLSKIYQEVARKGLGNLLAYQSVTCSYGCSLQVEATSLILLAAMKSKKPNQKVITEGIQYLCKSRTSYGFGSTQATILALKALTQYALFAPNKESGRFELAVNQHKIIDKSYQKDESNCLTYNNLDTLFKSGKHTISIRFSETKNPLPYSLTLSYNAKTPPSSADCKVDLQTNLSQSKAKMGETVRLTATLMNKIQNGLPMTIAVIGIPSGLSVQPWQLKELQDKRVFDYYETFNNYLVFYYTELEANAKKVISLDLKTELSGTYESPASSAYLYYTNEFKSWAKGEKVEIEK